MNAKHGIVAAAVGLVGLAGPALAHHGFDTEYDAKKKLSLTGVVTKIEWTNPHMHIYIDVTDANGRVTNWNMEGSSPNTVQRQGWGRRSLLPGDAVIFEGYGGKAVETFGSLSRIAKADSPNTPLFVQGAAEAAAQGVPQR